MLLVINLNNYKKSCGGMVDAQQETLVDFKTVRFSFVLGIVQNADSSPANSFYNNQVALEMQI